MMSSKTRVGITHLWAGTILVSLVLMCIYLFSKLGEAGVIPASDLETLPFVFSVLALSAVSFMGLGFTLYASSILDRIEGVVNEIPATIRYGAFVALTIAIAYQLTSGMSMDSVQTREELEALRSLGYVMAVVVVSPLIDHLPLDKHVKSLARRAKGVVA